MDHFVTGNDDLLKASGSGSLHRNFMGYTTQFTRLQSGLGVSAISDTGTAYAQNSKSLHDYYEHIDNGELAVEKGCFLNQEDETFKKYILNISCNGETKFCEQHHEKLKKFTFPYSKNCKKTGWFILQNVIWK